ncbi:MAG: M23 family metallopeptidase, partial [Cyanobacteria bacterium J06635_10]
NYKVRLRSDDGYRMWAHKLDGNPFNITENALGGKFLSDAYGGKEFTFVAPESGTFDFHAQMFERGGDALFDLSVKDLTAPPPPKGYYGELNTFSESQWDQQSGDNTQFEANPFGGGGDQRWKTDPRIEQIYTDLSNTIFGYRVAMTAGYAYDQSYYNGLNNKWHAGLDMGAANGTTIKAAIGGSVAWIDGSADGYVFVGINSDDGRQWVYGHLKSRSGLWDGKRINAGDTVGLIGYYSGKPHLHLEVRNSHASGSTGGAMTNRSKLLNITVSPLMAYWQWRNRNH